MFEQHLEDEAMYEREKVPKPEDDLVYVAPHRNTWKFIHKRCRGS